MPWYGLPWEAWAYYQRPFICSGEDGPAHGSWRHEDRLIPGLSGYGQRVHEAGKDGMQLTHAGACRIHLTGLEPIGPPHYKGKTLHAREMTLPLSRQTILLCHAAFA
jgi:2,4-dienoyl-CoA reductase-like NADH-dependent reductase (Old Yellow Enzyme family)